MPETITSHTPGPWFACMNYECRTLIRAGNETVGMRVATTFASHADQANAETRLKRIRVNEANARLIAAAPCLFEAANHIDRTATDIADDMVVISGGAYRLLRAAIAKASKSESPNV